MKQLAASWYRLRTSFWFVPSMCLVLAFLLAQGMVALDRALPLDMSSPWFSWIYGVGIDGSRAMLGAIGTAMLGVAATAFSITISVVVTASSTYGPRLVGSFMSDRGNQLVLGVFVSTFLYALLVLRTIRSEGDQLPAFVPHLAVNVAVLLAVADAVLLVWFIHHIATSVRVETLAHGVRTNFRSVVERMHPEEADDNVAHTEALAVDGAPITAGRVGYIVNIDFDKMCAVAAKHDLVIDVVPRVGDHILAHESIATVFPPDQTEDVAKAVQGAVRIGDARSEYQDVRFAEQQVLELAVRALSPGTNDPFTAINAIEEVAAGITIAASRPEPGNTLLDDSSTVRVRYRTVSVEEMVDMPFDQVRAFSMDHVPVLLALIDLAARIERSSIHPDLPDRLRRQVDVLMDDFRATTPHPHDEDRVQQHLTRRRDELGESQPTTS